MVSEALCWILLNYVKLPSVLHLLDDFLLINSPNDRSGTLLGKLKLLFRQLGVPLSEENTLGPTTSLEFLGILLDIVEMRASLPEEKLTRFPKVSKTFMSEKKHHPKFRNARHSSGSLVHFHAARLSFIRAEPAGPDRRGVPL